MVKPLTFTCNVLYTLVRDIFSPAATSESKKSDSSMSNNKITPTGSGRTSPSVTKTFPRKLSSPGVEEKKSKPAPRYGGFSGFGISYNTQKSPPATSPDYLRQTPQSPSPDTSSSSSNSKSPEPIVKSVPKANTEAVKKNNTKPEPNKPPENSVKPESNKPLENSVKNEPAVSTSSKTSSSKTSESSSSTCSKDSWRERLKEKQRLRELENEKAELERQQRAEQRAKEKGQKLNDQVKSIKDDSSSKKETTPIINGKSTPPPTKPPADSPVPTSTSPVPLSPTKKVSTGNRWNREEKAAAKPTKKYGGFSGFGVTYGSKSPSPSPSPVPDTSTKNISEQVIKNSKKDTNETSAVTEKSVTSKNTDTKKTSETTKTTNEDGDSSSSSTTSLSSNSSSSIKSGGSNTSLNRFSRGRQSDAGVIYFPTSKNKESKDTETNIANLLKNEKKEEAAPVNILNEENRWSEQSSKEAREEKEKLRKEIEDQENKEKKKATSQKSPKATADITPPQEKVKMRRRFGSKSNESAIGAFYRRRSHMIESEESFEGKSPTPSRHGSSTSPTPPAQSPSPKPVSPKHTSSSGSSNSLSSSSSASISSAESLSPPTLKDAKTSPKTLAPSNHSKQDKPTSPLTTKQFPPSAIPTIQENGHEESAASMESPNTVHTWRKPTPQVTEEEPPAVKQDKSSDSNRIAQQRIKMRALLDDDEAVIDSTKVEVHKIQQKKEVRVRTHNVHIRVAYKYTANIV